MNRQITRLAVVGVVLIASLIVATTYWQTWAVAGLESRQDNAIQRVAQFTIDRGLIYTADGTVLARNVRQRVKGKTLYFRRYPQAGLAAHAVGYSTQMRARAGLEQSMNDYLTGSNANLNTVLSTTVDKLRGATIRGNRLVLTIRPNAQRVALQALGGRCGAVVVLEPKTGRVLVMASSPTYDPNLVERRFGQISRIRAACAQAAPLLNRATRGLYAPGSTFKVVTAAAALDSGRYELFSTFNDPGFCIEYGKQVNNYDTSRPFGTVTFLQALQHSINSVFCNIGKEIGAGRILEYTKRFGFYSIPPLDTPVNERAASGLYENGRLFTPKNPRFDVDPGRLAFGQERLLVTPLQLAMVTAAVANGGVVMRPYLVERVLTPGGRDVVRRTKPDALGRAMKPVTAQAITRMMVAVVQAGTGTAAQLPGVTVAGKTGTAETGVAGVNTASFVAFAPAERPKLAIAVILESQRGTGGKLAAPIARQIMQAVLAPAAKRR